MCQQAFRLLPCPGHTLLKIMANLKPWGRLAASLLVSGAWQSPHFAASHISVSLGMHRVWWHTPEEQKLWSSSKFQRMPNSTSLTDRLSGWKPVGEPTSENSDKTSGCRHEIEVVSGSHWVQQEAESSRFFWSLPSPAHVAWSMFSRLRPFWRCDPPPCQQKLPGVDFRGKGRGVWKIHAWEFSHLVAQLCYIGNIRI